MGEDNLLDGLTVTSQGCGCTRYHGYTRNAAYSSRALAHDYGDVCGQWESKKDNPFHDECARGHYDWCGCSWCYVHSSCPGSIKSSVFKNGHWQRCSPRSGKDNVLDGTWTDKYKKGKHKHIYTISEGEVTKVTKHGDSRKKETVPITIRKGKIFTFLKPKKKGKHEGEVPEDEIHWDDDDTDTWIRLQDSSSARDSSSGKD